MLVQEGFWPWFDVGKFGFGVYKYKLVRRACKKQEKRRCLMLHSCFASITSENIKLVYLRRSLVKELLK